MGNKLIERRSGRMSHLKTIARGDKLATIPPANRTVHSKEVDRQRKEENQQVTMATYQLTTDLLKTSSHSSVTISPTKELSTEEKSREAG